MKLESKYSPKNLSDIIGQEHLVGKDGLFYKLLKQSTFPHLFITGATGSGKTTLCQLLSKEIGSETYLIDCAYFKSESFRKLITTIHQSLISHIIILDEVHYLNKSQLELLLPLIKFSNLTLLATSTEPLQSILPPALKSRVFIVETKPPQEEKIVDFIKQIADTESIKIDQKSIVQLANQFRDDFRSIFKFLELGKAGTIDANLLKSFNLKRESSSKIYDLTSALIKSMRLSQIDNALYFLAKLIDSNVEPQYIARRLAIFASEDISNANPNALNLTASTLTIVKQIGYPEAKIPLSQAVVYLSSSPKSRSSYQAINSALEYIENEKTPFMPEHLMLHNSATKDKNLFEEPFSFYKTNQVGFEKNLFQWHERIKNRL